MIKNRKNAFSALMSGLLILLMTGFAVAAESPAQGQGIEVTLNVIKNKAAKVDAATGGEKAAAKKALLDAVGEAISKAKNSEEAAQIIAAAVTAAPSEAVQITRTAIMAAQPSQAAAITSAAVTAAPTQAVRITRAAISVAPPSQAAAIAAAAITAAPNQAGQITRAAVAAAPQQRDAIIAAVPNALANANIPVGNTVAPPSPPAVGGGAASPN